MPRIIRLAIGAYPNGVRPVPRGETWPAPPPPPERPSQPTPDPEFVAALARIEQALAGLDEQRRSQLAEWQEAAVELALAVAAQLMHQEFVEGRYPVEEIVRDAIGQLGIEGASEVTVRLNPKDAELLRRRSEADPSLGELAKLVKLEADASLSHGDCLAESNDKLITSQLQFHFAQVREELLGSLGHARA